MEKLKKQHTFTIDGVPSAQVQPHAIEMEAAVLGAIMLDVDAFSAVQNILEPEFFYLPANQKIYQAVKTLYAQYQPIDMLTVIHELQRTGKLEEIGGAYYLTTLTQNVCSAIHIEHHAVVVFERFIARRIVAAGQKITTLGFDQALDIDQMVTGSESQINDIITQITGKVDIAHIGKSLNEALNNAYKRVDNTRKNIRSGVATGLVCLDRITCGWQKANLIVLAARPSMGKTAIMLHLAKAAARSGTPVVIFSLEMSDVSLSNRLILSECTVAIDRFRSGYMDNNELKQLESAAGIINEMPIYIDDNSDVTIGFLRSRAKALKKQGKCGAVFIDYLQLCREIGIQGRTREQEVSAMSREAKIIAKELDIPVILLSQLSRSVEQRADRKPQLSDLRDSGSIEQDADIVIFIWRPEYYGIEVVDKHGNIEEKYGELLVEKNRDGATGKVKFRHNVGMTQIYDYHSNIEPYI